MNYFATGLLIAIVILSIVANYDGKEKYRDGYQDGFYAGLEYVGEVYGMVQKAIADSKNGEAPPK